MRSNFEFKCRVLLFSSKNESLLRIIGRGPFRYNLLFAIKEFLKKSIITLKLYLNLGYGATENARTRLNFIELQSYIHKFPLVKLTFPFYKVAEKRGHICLVRVYS